MAYDPLAALANPAAAQQQRPMAQGGYPALSYDAIQNGMRRRSPPWNYADQYGAEPQSYAAMVQDDPYGQTPDTRPGKAPPYWQTPDVRPSKGGPYEQTPDVRPPPKSPPYYQTPDVRPQRPAPRPVVDRFPNRNP